MEHDLDLRRNAIAGANPVQAGGNDTGIIEDHHVTGPQISGQVPNPGINQIGGNAGLHDEQARCVARLHRAQRNIPLGQMEIEIA